MSMWCTLPARGPRQGLERQRLERSAPVGGAHARAGPVPAGPTQPLPRGERLAWRQAEATAAPPRQGPRRHPPPPVLPLAKGARPSWWQTLRSSLRQFADIRHRLAHATRGDGRDKTGSRSSHDLHHHICPFAAASHIREARILDAGPPDGKRGRGVAVPDPCGGRPSCQPPHWTRQDARLHHQSIQGMSHIRSRQSRRLAGAIGHPVDLEAADLSPILRPTRVIVIWCA